MNMDDEGKRLWIFPDGELPPPGSYDIKGHESLILLNTSSSSAHVNIVLYFVDDPPVKGIALEVAPERVRCIRMDNPEDLSGFVLEKEKQYAMRIESDVPIVAQYGRLDTREQPMAFYTTSGYCQ